VAENAGGPAPHQTPYHRFGVWLTRFVPGVYLMRYGWTPLDRLVFRLRGGRHGMGPRTLPFMLLTTVGRKTGRTRSTPVLYLQEGPSYVIVGSNYGRRGHPAWTHNLISTPEATVQVGDRSENVLARRATAEEYERYWPQLVEIWPGWRTYRKMTGREFRMFVLEPAGAARR
jgi:deazaflavin-dependent oxidoreductase (nitroreductase family)